MARIIAGIIIVAVLGGGTAGVWGVASRPAPPFVPAGATAVTVTALGRGAWQIRYDAPGATTTWYADLARQLETRGWTSEDRVAYAPLNRAYTRATHLGVVVVWEWVFFSFDPWQQGVVQIRVRRAIDVPLWRRITRLVAAAQNVMPTLLQPPAVRLPEPTVP